MTGRRRAAACLAAGALAAGAVGCQSTQDKSKQIGEKGSNAFKQKGLTITKASTDLAVSSRTVLTDQNGSAVVLELRNRTPQAYAAVPVSIDLKNARGRSVFKNDAPGLEPSLVAAPLVAGGTTTLWVNDQVQAVEPPKSVVAKVGAAKPVTGSIPKLSIQGLKLEQDPVDGILASGKIRNESDVLQRKLVIFAVARKGGRIVAAGRAGVERLKPGKKAGFAIFFIGNPKGAKLEVFAPPTVLA
jgi:hypothetical protein